MGVSLPRCLRRGLSLVRPAGVLDILAVLPHRPPLAEIEAAGLIVGLKYLDLRDGRLKVIFELATIEFSPFFSCGGVCAALSTVHETSFAVSLRMPLRGSFSGGFSLPASLSCLLIILSEPTCFPSFLYLLT